MPDGNSAASQRFATTQWSVVLAAQQDQSPQALDTLCRAYWYPVYAFVRRRGFAAHDAQDLTQEFFARLIEKESLLAVDRERGRFRTFLLVAAQRFLANTRRDRAAQKRGGGRPRLSLDYAAGERRYACEPADPMTPERLFVRRWALTMLERVLEQLRQQYTARGREALFEQLAACLLEEPQAASYAQIAAQLNMTPAAVKVAAHRLRQHYRDLVREEVLQTVADERDVDDELRHLMEAVQNIA